VSDFSDFPTDSIRPAGYYSQRDQYWLLRPSDEWKLLEAEDNWLEVGGPGVDGISFVLKRGEQGVFAYYPIEREFVWKARDAESLIAGWLASTISVRVGRAKQIAPNLFSSKAARRQELI
jgi:hypothetical protein